MTAPKANDPDRIKVYGLFPTTRRRYVVQVVVAAALVVFLLVAWGYFRASGRERLVAMESPLMTRVVSAWDLVPWLVAAVAALQAVEAYFVFRAFARKGAAAAPAPANPPPPAPADAGGEAPRL